jgi:hypothetical protein
MYIYGEWVGPGIHKGPDLAVNKLARRVFAPFCRWTASGGYELIYNTVEETSIKCLPEDIYPVIVVDSVVIVTDGDNTEACKSIEEKVAQIGAISVWAKTYFDIEGTGEGVVYARSGTELLSFKAKVPEFRARHTANAVGGELQELPDVSEWITPARVCQVLEESQLVNTPKNYGSLIKAVIEDARNEGAPTTPQFGKKASRVVVELLCNME